MLAIVARSENNVIGLDGGLPWRCKGDLQFFKRTTMGCKIVVGRTTFDGLPPLSGRDIYVLTRNPDRQLDNATAIQQIEDLPDDAIICGGASIYDLTLDRCNKLFVTTVKQNVEGDTYFNSQWLNGFSFVEIVEETNDYSIAAYERQGE